MKAIINTKIHEAELQEVPIRNLEPHEIKIKVAYCAVGHNDAFMIDSGLTGVPRPWPLGYLASGTIVEMGKNANRLTITSPNPSVPELKIGDRVTLDQHRSCGACYYCLNGEDQFCVRLSEDPRYGWVDGLLREYVIYFQQQVHKLPDTVSLEEGALTEIVAACLRGIDFADIKIGNRVLISGGGVCGLTLLQLAILQGGTKLTLVEPVESKRELALKLGADYVIDPAKQDIVSESMKITNNRGFDRVIEASGNPDAINPCFDSIGKCGKIVLLGCYPSDYRFTFNIEKIRTKEASIHTTFGFKYMYPRAVAILPKLDLKSLIGPIYPLEKWEEAFVVQRTFKYPTVFIKF